MIRAFPSLLKTTKLGVGQRDANDPNVTRFPVTEEQLQKGQVDSLPGFSFLYRRAPQGGEVEFDLFSDDADGAAYIHHGPNVTHRRHSFSLEGGDTILVRKLSTE
jgi:hypothetical protein